MSVRLSLLITLNPLTDFHETRYENSVTRGNPHLSTFQFIVNENMAAVQNSVFTCLCDSAYK